MPIDPPSTPDAQRRLQVLRELGLGDADATPSVAALTDALLAARDERQRLHDFGRASGDWTWETDERLRITWLSEAFEPATGLPPSSVVGRLLPDLPLLDARGLPQASGEGLLALLRRQQPFSRAVTEMPTPRGLLYVSRSAVPVFGTAGGFAGHRGTARDVTAQVEAARREHGHDQLRRETEHALRRSEERWEMAADAAGIGIAEADLASGLLILDRRACMNHGLPYPMEGFTLADWLAQIDPADRAATEAGLQQALQSGRSFETRYLAHRPDGSRATLEVTARGRYDAQGRAVGLVGTCRDVTAQLAVDRLQRDKETAERANRAKSEFLSRMSHELRTPLNGILGFAQLMALDRDDGLAPAQQRRLDSVVQAGRHLLGLINDVLDLTRIESDDFTLQPACVDAWLVLRDCLALIQPLAREAGVRLPTLPTPLAPAWVQADPRALEQVLMNLLSNAIKYNRPGGRVDVELVPDLAGGRIAIAIRDEGRGMDSAQQAALFQPFHRLGAEPGRPEGSGLGLLICRRLLEQMDGALRVDSRPGIGSTFALELPAGQGAPSAPPRAAAPQAGAPQASTGPREVLYIEDEPLNMVLMEEVFRSRPEWTLLVADDGATGLRIAREARPHLVLIDMNLPDTHGLALIRRLRADPATGPLRCIALSADAMREQIDAAMAAGFDDYWTKPIDVQRVLDDLGRLLAEPAAAAAAP